MRPWSRPGRSLTAACDFAFALGSVPAVLAQSDTPWPVAPAPTAAPGTVCALLTNDEVGQALGFAVTGYGSSVLDCAWQGDITAGISTKLALTAQAGSILDGMKAGLLGGTDLTIGGDAAYFSPDLR